MLHSSPKQPPIPNKVEMFTSVTTTKREVVLKMTSEDHLKKRIEALELKINSVQTLLQQVLPETNDIKHPLEQWQTTNLVLHAFGIFACSEVSNSDKLKLAKQNIRDFLDLFYATRFASSIQVRNVTWHVYNKLDLNLCYYTHNIIAKRDVITERTNLAHPTISQECLEEFLNHLGANSQNLEPLEVALFNHLKSTSNTPENVQRAARSP